MTYALISTGCATVPLPTVSLVACAPVTSLLVLTQLDNGEVKYTQGQIGCRCVYGFDKELLINIERVDKPECSMKELIYEDRKAKGN